MDSALSRWTNILRTWNTFSWNENHCILIHWDLYLMYPMTINQGWLKWWLYIKQVTSHYLSQGRHSSDTTAEHKKNFNPLNARLHSSTLHKTQQKTTCIDMVCSTQRVKIYNISGRHYQNKEFIWALSDKRHWLRFYWQHLVWNSFSHIYITYNCSTVKK